MAVTIPRPQRQVLALQAAQPVQANAGEFMAGARAMQQVGRDLHFAAAQADEAYQLHDNAKAQEAFLEASSRRRDLLYNPENGLMNQTGSSALDVAVRGEKAYNEIREEIARGLGNERQKRLFRDGWDAQRDETVGRLQGHQASQYKSYIIGQSKAIVANEGEEAIANYADPGAVSKHIAQGRAELQKNIAGKPPEAVAGDVSLFESTVHKGVVDRFLATEDLDGAKSYLEKHKGQMEGGALDALSRSIRVEERRLLAEERAREAERVSALRGPVSAAISAMSEGREFKGLGTLEASVAGTPLEEPLRAAKDGMALRQEYALLPESEKQALREELETGTATVKSEEQLDALRDVFKEEDKETNAEAKERFNAVKAELLTAAEALAAGRDWADLDSLVERADEVGLGQFAAQIRDDEIFREEFARRDIGEKVSQMDAMLDAGSSVEAERKLAAISDVMKADKAAIDNGTVLERAAQLGLIEMQPVDVFDPDSVKARAQQTRIASEHFGVDAPLLTKGEKSQVVQQYNALEPSQQVQFMGELAASGGDNFTEVMRQLGGKGGLPQSGRYLAALQGRPEAQTIANALAEGLATDEKELKIGRERHGWSSTDVDAEVFDELEEFFDTVGGTYAGGADSGVAGSAFQTEVADTVTRTALVLMRTMEPNDAIEEAAKKIINDRYIFQDGYRVPREIMPGVEYPIDRLQQQMDDTVAVLGSVEGLEVPGSASGVPDKIRRDGYLESITQAPNWATLPDESGLVLMDPLGNPVSLSGKPVIVKF